MFVGIVKGGEPLVLFEVGAQLLPILFVLVLVEYKNFGTPWSDPDAQVSALAAGLAIFSGVLFLFAESAAIEALESGEASDFERRLVSAALAYYVLLVFATPTQSFYGPVFRSLARHRARRTERGDDAGDSD